MTSTDMMIMLSDYLKKTFFKVIENKYKICIDQDWDEWIKEGGAPTPKPVTTAAAVPTMTKKKGLPRHEQEPISIMDLKLFDSDKALKDKYKVAKLKTLCEERGLPKSGTREQLRLSLIDYEQQYQNSEEAPCLLPAVEPIGIIEPHLLDNPLTVDLPPNPVLTIIEQHYYDVVDLHPDYNSDFYFILFKGSREVKGFVTEWDGTSEVNHVDVQCNLDKHQIKCLKTMGLEYMLPSTF